MLYPTVMNFSWLLVILLIGGSESGYVATNMNLSAVPTDIPADSTSLYLNKNILSEIAPSSLSHLYRITYLQLANNKFTQFPDLGQEIGDTLLYIHIEYNNIVFINTTRLQFLVKLRSLHIYSNPSLSVLPNLDGLLPALVQLDISRCNFSTLPNTTNRSTMILYAASGNDLRFIDGLLFNSYIQKLTLQALLVTEVPDLRTAAENLILLDISKNAHLTVATSERLALLGGLEDLYIKNCPLLSTIASTCPRDVALMEIRATRLPKFNPCACEHLWLKQAEDEGATVSVDSTICGGDTWQAQNTTQLLKECTPLAGVRGEHGMVER